MQEEIDYTVVVPAWNEEALLPATLRALRTAMRSTNLRGEIVVTDNASTDATASIARAFGARVVHEPVRRIARARNAGAAVARGRHLVFVDADSRVSAALLRGALDRLESGRFAGGGSTFTMDVGTGRLARTAVAGWLWISRRLHLAAGSFVWVRRDVFETVGGFPETVYVGEEIGLSRAVKREARRRGLDFAILDHAPLRTSGRKLTWFSTLRMATQFALLAVLPFLARSRAACFTWYRRPAAPGGAA